MPTIDELIETCEGNFKEAHWAYMRAEKLYIRTRLAEAQNWKCCWCGRDCTDELDRRHSMTIEHIVPKSRGGKDTWENLAMACNRCNQKRGSEMKYKEINVHLALIGTRDTQ
jgi:5-methylcytosine-specific restriction endonuclease McrA